jgi:hypothetical protein
MENDITETGRPLTLSEILVLIDTGLLDLEDDTEEHDNNE